MCNMNIKTPKPQGEDIDNDAITNELSMLI